MHMSISVHKCELSAFKWVHSCIWEGLLKKPPRFQHLDSGSGCICHKAKLEQLHRNE